MGVVGIHVFDDDMACSHLAYCSADIPSPPFDDFRDSLERCLGYEYIETDLSGEVLTVAVLLIALNDLDILNRLKLESVGDMNRQRVLDFVTKHCPAWGALDATEKKELVDMTVRSISERVLVQERCESYELWLDTDDLDDWLAEVRALREALEESSV